MKIAVPALALVAALGLSACQQTETVPADDTAAAGDTTVINEAPATGETPVVVQEAEPAGSGLTIDGADVDATVSEEGVQADVNVDN